MRTKTSTVSIPRTVPATGSPEVSGLTPLQVQMILRGVRRPNIVGGDVVAVARRYDPATNTAHVAARLLFEQFTLLAVKWPDDGSAASIGR